MAILLEIDKCLRYTIFDASGIRSLLPWSVDEQSIHLIASKENPIMGAVIPEDLAVETPAAVQQIEGVGVPSAAFVDQATYIRTVRAGLSGEVVKHAIDAIGHRDFFVRLLGTTSGHLSRLYRRKSLGAARTEGLLDTLRLFAAAAAAFGGLERAQDWLGTGLPALGGDRPIDLCDTFEGRRLVREIIRKVEYGEFP